MTFLAGHFPLSSSVMSITTKRGDDGQTDLLFGRRIAKTALRVEVLGTLDELNSALGMARAAQPGEEIDSLLDGWQQRLVPLMGELAFLPEDSPRYDQAGYKRLTPEDLAWVEEITRDIESQNPRFKLWARPGDHAPMASATLDFARTVARRAERHVWLLQEAEGGIAPHLLLFLNRTSDALWLLARTLAPKKG